MRAEDGIDDFDGRRAKQCFECVPVQVFRSKWHKVPVIVGKTLSTRTSESFVSKE
jgi:hypothetical protein